MTTATTATPDLDQLAPDLDRLGRMVRTAPRFIDAVRWWSGFPLRGEQIEPAAVEPLSEASAALFDLAPGTLVLRREMHLVGAMSGPIVVVASVTEYVHEPLIGADLAARRALRDGAQPIDVILDGLHRATYLVTRSALDLDNQADEAPALQSHAVLSGAGRPIALTTEIIHRQLLTQRSPDTIPHYAAHIPHASRITP